MPLTTIATGRKDTIFFFFTHHPLSLTFKFLYKSTRTYSVPGSADRIADTTIAAATLLIIRWVSSVRSLLFSYSYFSCITEREAIPLSPLTDTHFNERGYPAWRGAQWTTSFETAVDRSPLTVNG